MPNFTPNLNLKKPLETEFYNIADFNDNMDIIDTLPDDIINSQPIEQYAESESAVTTTSTSFQTGLTLNVAQDGEYIVNFSSEVDISSTSYLTTAQLIYNDLTVINIYVFSKSQGSASGIFSGMKKINLTTGDTLKLQYKSSSSSGTASMSKMRIYLKEYKGS